MATSTVRGQVSIFAMDQGDTITAKLNETKPLIQYINGTVASPDWAGVPSERPIIYPYVMSTLSTGVVTAISNAEWFFNDVKITFPSNDFEETTYTLGGVAVPALRIKANIMLAMTSDKSIRGSFDVLTGGNTTRITLTKDVRRQITSSTGYDAVLDADRGGIIDNANTSLQVRAILKQGGQNVTGFTVDWYKFVANDTDGTNDGETPLGKTGNPITLAKADIELMETIFARFKVGGTVVATAIYTIHDFSDPFEMIFSHSASKVTPSVSLTTTVSVISKGDVTATPRPEFTQFAFSLRNGLVEVRNKARGTNTFVTNFSDFVGTKQLNLLVETKDTWV